jgi:hypothetical protein
MTVSEGLRQRSNLLPDNVDPRVVHYLALHSIPGYTKTALSFGASLLSGGLTSTIENIDTAVEDTGLGGELAKLALDLSKENQRGISESRNSSEMQSYREADELVKALAALAEHFGGSSVVSGLKMIPFYVGTVIGALQTGSRLALGFSGAVEDACEVLHRFAKRNHPYALKVAALLGIPEEIMAAEGGIRVIKTRL